MKQCRECEKEFRMSFMHPVWFVGEPLKDCEYICNMCLKNKNSGVNKDMDSETFLYKSILQMKEGFKYNVEFIRVKGLGTDFEKGQLAGLFQAIGAVEALLRLYKRKVETNDLPEDIEERLAHANFEE